MVLLGVRRLVVQRLETQKEDSSQSNGFFGSEMRKHFSTGTPKNKRLYVRRTFFLYKGGGTFVELDNLEYPTLVSCIRWKGRAPPPSPPTPTKQHLSKIAQRVRKKKGRRRKVTRKLRTRAWML